MAKVYVFLANGFEDVEAMAPIDILRRGNQQVITVSINDTEKVTSAHGVTVLADRCIRAINNVDDADLLFIPGGMPGAKHLDECPTLQNWIRKHCEAGKKMAAICAAPMVLGHLGLLKGRRATCYPGFEMHLEGAQYTAELVTEDGNITTGEGPAAALPFGYKLLSYFVDEQQVKALQDGMRYTHLMDKRA